MVPQVTDGVNEPVHELLFILQCELNTVQPLILVTLNFGVWVNLILLDPVILAFLLPTTLKRYCIQIFVAHYFRELVRLAKFAK